MFNPVILIPFYNHVDGFSRMVEKLNKHNFPIVLVNDGSNGEQTEKVKKICEKFGIKYIGYSENKGKGYAVKTGFSYAEKNGYTHILQIDADGQHNPDDIPVFIDLARKNPEALINGCPVYDETVPKSRLYGRKITDFWVYIETGGADIPDSMCGFRIYPIEKTKSITDSIFCMRMGFDIEIIVKCAWKKIAMIHQPTKVIYFADGVSHFKMFKDNFRISMMHAALCCLAVINLIKGIFNGNRY